MKLGDIATRGLKSVAIAILPVCGEAAAPRRLRPERKTHTRFLPT